MILDAEALLPVIISLVRDELLKIRGDSNLNVGAGTWNAKTQLQGEEIGADSIERVMLTTAASEYFGLFEIEMADYLLSKKTLGEWSEVAAQAIQENGFICFRSSGTVGASSVHRHELADLVQEVAFLTHLFSGTKRLINLAPTHHIYGFIFGIMLPRGLACPVLYDHENRGIPPTHLRQGDLVVSFPLRWRQMARFYPVFPSGLTGVTSTSPCPPDLAQDLKNQGLERFVSIYGATETAGIGYREDHDEPYRLMDYWHSDGEFLYRMKNESLGRAVTPPDFLEFQDTHQFRLAGRRDCAVQVAGVNVYLDQVAEKLRAFPGVGEAVVRLNEASEPRLIATIVPNVSANSDELKASLQTWCRNNLRAPERPVQLIFSEAISRTALGKPRLG